MDFKKILENKPLLYGIIAAVAVVLAFGIMATIMIAGGKSSSNEAKMISEKPIQEDLVLLTTDNIGKAIEIQALLAKVGITASRSLDGTKSSIVLRKGTYNQSQRDAALLEIVKSGLMDQNVGLEIFDKGDFTSTKEDKRIRLARAINGELARLIRKMDGIDNASVFISIPEQTMFSSMQKPVTATVQLTTTSNGEKLPPLKIKAITNLLLGSVTGLTADNISITDTNGNVYSSIIGVEDEMLQKIEENDKYMQQKVNAQLDRLIGKGNYVVTVSTSLKQSPVEKSSIIYDPKQKASVSEQTFVEGLGDESSDNSKGTGRANAVSLYLPNGLNPALGTSSQASVSSQNRNYSRQARETQYGVSKTQINEYMKPGVIEEISIAVTLEKNALPTDATLEEMKELIARSASPKVKPENVTIALSETIEPYLATDRPENLPKPEETGNPWWLALAMVGVCLTGGYIVVSSKIKANQLAQQQEMQALRNKSTEQEEQLRDVSIKAAELIEHQNQLQQSLIEQQQRQVVPQIPSHVIDEALAAIKSDVDALDPNETGEKIKSWIEQA
ncbi:MAG: flagellar M-ring protein FliF C-terminal domain-containing protein [Candidatus Gastranaerophilaceae bacterium]